MVWPERNIALLLVPLLSACGGRAVGEGVISGVPSCVPGEQVACACPSQRSSVQVCTSDGNFGPCACGEPTASGGSPGGSFPSGNGGSGSGSRGGTSGIITGGSVGTGATAGKSAGGTAGAPTTAGGPVLTSGEDKLIEVFPADTGLLVVSANSVRLTDRAGGELRRLPSAREITAAAFDGATLVVADKGRFSSYDSALNALSSGDLAEACASAVLVSNSRFVCGPANDWDRVFYTYDALSGKLLASSKQYTYNGIPMRRVPGTDDFVTVSTSSSPSDFHLYTVKGDEAAFVNESPYHGDFRVTNVYAFDASPPEHLVTDTGLLLHIYGDACSSSASSFTSACFVKDGALGTLSGSQVFVGMDSDETGTVYGLVDPSNSFSSNPCSKTCMAQRIDVASRTVTSQRLHALTAARVVVTRHDPISDKLLVGYIKGPGTYFASDPYPGYQVALLDYR